MGTTNDRQEPGKLGHDGSDLPKDIVEEDANQEIGVRSECANQEIGVPGKCANQEIGVPRETDIPRVPVGGPMWHSRGYLPHFESARLIQHVTFHLADSLPAAVLERFDDEVRFLPAAGRDVERRKRCEEWLDAGQGSCILRDPDVAAMVEDSLLSFDGRRYRVLAWAVMPNHVHVLFEPISGHTVARIVASWKKFTATHICAFRRSAGTRGNAPPGNAPGNANLPIGGMKIAAGNAPGNANLLIGVVPAPVWHREYWDRYIRDGRHLENVVSYIHNNPVKAGLVARAEDWRWGSARLHRNEDEGDGKD